MVVFKDRNVSLVFLMEVLLKNADFVLVTLITLKLPQLTFEFSHACTETKFQGVLLFLQPPATLASPPSCFLLLGIWQASF